MTYIPGSANGKKSSNNTTTTNIGGSTQLNGAHNSSVDTITVDSTIQFPSSGTLSINSEYITYTGTTPTTFTGCTRGDHDSTAASHSNNDTIYGCYIGTSDFNSQADVIVSIKCDQNGTLYFDFSDDDSNWDAFPSSGYTYAANTHELHNAVKGPRYYRTVFVNSSSTLTTTCRITTYFGVFKEKSIALNQTVTASMETALNRSVIMGTTDGGQYINVPVTNEGHLEVALQEPKLPFGSIHMEKLHPIIQTDAVYALNSHQTSQYTVGSGAITQTDSMFRCRTSTTANSKALLRSKERIRYMPGQGIIGRYTAIFSARANNSFQLAGLGHEEDGYYFGYAHDGSDFTSSEFGIIHMQRGLREVRTLTVSVASSHNENINIQLNSTNYSVAVTDSGNINRTVWEIAQGTYNDWECYPTGSTIVFVSKEVGSLPGTYNINSSTSTAGTFAQTRAGVDTTNAFIAQSNWNADKLDGTGNSGATLDPTKGNIYQIGIQYLGFGTITFQIAISTADNDSKFVNVHKILNPNTLTTTHVSNPSFSIIFNTYTVNSATDDLSLYTGSFAGFIEGEKTIQGNRFSFTGSIEGTTATIGTYECVYTIYNKLYYQNKSNQSIINILDITSAFKHNKPGIIYLLKNPALTGNPNFSDYDSSESCAMIDTSAANATISNNRQLLWTGLLGETGNIFFEFKDKITLQPGEWLTIAVATLSGTAADVMVSINTIEDQ